MLPGEEFEIKCYEFLKKKYGNDIIVFNREGGMDSTKSDIAVKIKGSTVFNIEVKDSNAQSGQFVLVPNETNKTFIFSSKNKSQENEMTKMIIDYINSDFNVFCNAGTAGKALDIDSSIFSNWIINHYADKKVKYIISYLNDFVIIPIRKFSEYFEISSTFRVKKSGSAKPSQKDISAIIEKIKEKYSLCSFSSNDDHQFVEIKESVVDKKFVIGDYTYFLSEKMPHLYEIRRLSNTNNMNVIFSIKLIKSQVLSDLKEFELDLKNLS